MIVKKKCSNFNDIDDDDDPTNPKKRWKEEKVRLLRMIWFLQKVHQLLSHLTTTFVPFSNRNP
jgi:hypothetical protein